MLARLEIVLVGTSNAENLGGVARLCENFATTTPLALVAPRAQPDDHRALVVGRAARQRLAEARRFATLDEAVAGASYVVGFSARRGGVGRRTRTSRRSSITRSPRSTPSTTFATTTSAPRSACT
jgi:tRNA C32,U32 (ribose-2'-O)-methylase TrmJ